MTLQQANQEGTQTDQKTYARPKKGVEKVN
jgi:hypothetical protein